MRRQGVDIDAVRRRLARDFTVDGPERISKIIPAEKDTADKEKAIQQGKYWNKNLDPVAQWILLVRAKFIVEKHYPGEG